MKKITMTKRDVLIAVQTYLNEHVVKEPLALEAVEATREEQYNSKKNEMLDFEDLVFTVGESEAVEAES